MKVYSMWWKISSDVVSSKLINIDKSKLMVLILQVDQTQQVMYES